jgi:hypothetical protein
LSSSLVVFSVLFIADGRWSQRKLFSFLIFLPFYILYLSNFNTTVIFKRLVNSYLVITSCGYIIWLLQLFNLLQPAMTIPFMWGRSESQSIDGSFGINFNVQAITSPISFIGSSIYRFTSLYVEGPVYAGIALIFLALALYWVKSKPIIIIMLSVFALSSFTTTATLGVPALFVPLIFSQIISRIRTNRNMSYRFFYVFIALIVVLGLFTLADMFANILSQKSETSSGEIHFSDYIYGFQAFIDKPVFGHGLENIADLEQYTLAYKGMYSMTSGLISVMAQGGALLMFFYILPLCVLIKKFEFKSLQWIVPITVLIIFAITSVEDMSLIIFFMALSYSKIDLKL